jgi:hypothetical protein
LTTGIFKNFYREKPRYVVCLIMEAGEALMSAGLKNLKIFGGEAHGNKSNIGIS